MMDELRGTPQGVRCDNVRRYESKAGFVIAYRYTRERKLPDRLVGHVPYSALWLRSLQRW